MSETTNVCRAARLANAQQVIQTKYEKHGLNPEFLNVWLLNYLKFLLVRKSVMLVSIHDAPTYFHQEAAIDQDRIIDLWMNMLHPTSQNPASKAKGIHGFRGVNADGMRVPIHNWINSVFVTDGKRSKIKQQHDSYRNPQLIDELENVGGVMGAESSAEVSNMPAHQRDWYDDRLNRLKRDLIYFISNWTLVDASHGHRDRIIIAQIITEMNFELNSTEIARRMTAGEWQPIPKWKMSPFPLKVNVRTIQRQVASLKEGLRGLATDKGFRTPKPNCKGFDIAPPRSYEEQLSLNGSYRGKGSDPVGYLSDDVNGVKK